MLFSSPEAANYINSNFEPTWVSVRPVPKVTIDFGNGKKMTRTINGNIATYVCTKDGTVVDVLPGIYNRENYMAALDAIHEQYYDLPTDSTALERGLKTYHETVLPEPIIKVQTVDAALRNRSPQAVRGSKTGINETEALQSALLADTSLNETERRPMIHEYLKTHAMSTPDDMKKWLYRVVLHADLDDPYLGFDRALTQTYPFDDAGS